MKLTLVCSVTGGGRPSTSDRKVRGWSSAVSGRSAESRTRSDGSVTVVMGYEAHSRLFGDGRRPTVDIRSEGAGMVIGGQRQISGIEDAIRRISDGCHGV